jgi:hypothetical protein
VGGAIRGRQQDAYAQPGRALLPGACRFFAQTGLNLWHQACQIGRDLIRIRRVAPQLPEPPGQVAGETVGHRLHLHPPLLTDHHPDGLAVIRVGLDGEDRLHGTAGGHPQVRARQQQRTGGVWPAVHPAGR